MARGDDRMGREGDRMARADDRVGSIGQVYLETAKETLQTWKATGEKTFTQLNDADIKFQPHPLSNSISMIVQHLHGNFVSRWTDFLTTDGEKPTRQRDAEFEGGYDTKEAMLRDWEEGWRVWFKALNELTEGDLLKTVYIRGQASLALQAIERAIAHCANHIGQIVYIGKQLKGDDWDCLSIPRRR